MFPQLEKLLMQRLVLNAKKFEFLRDINPQSYLASQKPLRQIQFIIRKEILLNKKLCKSLENLSVEKQLKYQYIDPICFHLQEINSILEKEHKILDKANHISIALSQIKYFLTRKDGYFSRILRRFKKQCDKEVKENQIFLELSHTLPKKFQLNEKKLQSSLKLLQELQTESKSLVQTIGNEKEVKKRGKHMLLLIEKIQDTEIYEFVQNDVGYIKKKVEYIVKHPKESKLAYAFATFYIVSPGTFELTGAILFFRYLGKYTVSKTKKIKKKFRKKLA